VQGRAHCEQSASGNHGKSSKQGWQRPKALLLAAKQSKQGDRNKPSKNK